MMNMHPRFSEEYEIHYFVNYQKQKIPEELYPTCELLIYQPLGKIWDDLCSEVLLSRMPAGCRTISFNYLTFPVYWPFFAQDSRNIRDETYPFGQFPYGDSLVLELKEQGTSDDEILERYFDETYVKSKFDPDSVLEEYIRIQKDLEDRRDQKLLDYVLANYRTSKLFETFNHPTRQLCIYQTNDLLRILGYDPIDEDRVPDLSYLQRNQQPIHPVVASSLGLEFDCDSESIYNAWSVPLTFREYSEAYVRWDTGAIGTPVV